MITDRDITVAAYIQGVALRDSRVQSAMATQVVACRGNLPLEEVEHLMQKAQVRRVPVVNSDGKLIGLVTLSDIARSAQSGAREHAPRVAETLANITARRSRDAVAAE